MSVRSVIVGTLFAIVLVVLGVVAWQTTVDNSTIVELTKDLAKVVDHLDKASKDWATKRRS